MQHKTVHIQEAVPWAAAIPHGIYLGLFCIEVPCAIGVMSPAPRPKLGVLVQIMAALIPCARTAFA